MSLFGFPKSEHLCGRTCFQQLFKEGTVYYASSVKLVCHRQPASAFRILAGVSVPKKLFRHAVDRNRIKRLLREAYRLRKPSPGAFAEEAPCELWLLFVYTGHVVPSYDSVQKSVNLLLAKMEKGFLTDKGKKNAAD